MNPVNLEAKLATFSEHWQPRTVTQFNGHDIMVVKAQGEFVWHRHDETDDFFLVLKGHLTIELRDRNVQLGPGNSLSSRKGSSIGPSRTRKCTSCSLSRRDAEYRQRGDCGTSPRHLAVQAEALPPGGLLRQRAWAASLACLAQRLVRCRRAWCPGSTRQAGHGGSQAKAPAAVCSLRGSGV